MTRLSPTAAWDSTSDAAALRSAAASLVLFAGVVHDEVGRAFLALLDALNAPAPEDMAIRIAYGRLFLLLADEAELDREALAEDAWQSHLLRRLLHDENPFSRKAQAAPAEAMGPAL